MTDGVGPDLAVRGLTAGYGVGLVADATAVAVRSNAVRIVPVRPFDVTATNGQALVVTQGCPLPLEHWPIDADLKPVALPALRYRASAAADHAGSAVFAVHGLPPDLASHGLRVLLTLQAPVGTAGFAWALTLTVPKPHPLIPNVWGVQQYEATVNVPGFVSDEGAAPSRVVEVTDWAPQISPAPEDTVACVDGVTRPCIRPLSGQLTQPNPLLLALRLACSAALPADVDILGLTLVLVPAVNS